MSLMANAQKKKALEYIENAEKSLSKRSSLLGGLLLGGGGKSKEQNAEDAAEFYMSGANAYKVGGLLQEAGDTYIKAAALYQDIVKNTNDAAKCYNQAGVCYKKVNGADAIQAYQSAILLLTDAGRLTQAAKLCKECAELYENDQGDIIQDNNNNNNNDEGEGDTTTTTTSNTNTNPDGKSSIVLAIEFYDQAAEYYTMEESKSASQQCLSKIAELCSVVLEPPDLLRAAQIYNDSGKQCLDSNLLKYNAKGYFLQAILCHLANSDIIAARESLSRYESIDYTFIDSREGKFCTSLIESVENYDAEALSVLCFEYDRISKLDPWKTKMLIQIKRSIQNETGEQHNDHDDDVDLT